MHQEVDAIFENGVLKPTQPLTLAEGQRVRVILQSPVGRARASAGLIPCPKNIEDLDAFLSADNHPWVPE